MLTGGLTGLVQIGDLLVDTIDTYPSSAVSSAQFDPLTLTVTITFRDGSTYDYPCSLDTWLAYQASDSRGGFVNAHFR